MFLAFISSLHWRKSASDANTIYVSKEWSLWRIELRYFWKKVFFGVIWYEMCINMFMFCDFLIELDNTYPTLKLRYPLWITLMDKHVKWKTDLDVSLQKSEKPGPRSPIDLTGILVRVLDGEGVQERDRDRVDINRNWLMWLRRPRRAAIFKVEAQESQWYNSV